MYFVLPSENGIPHVYKFSLTLMLYGILVVCLMFFLPTYRYNYAQYYAGIIGTSLLQRFVPSVYGIKLPAFYKVFSEKASMVAYNS